MKSRHNDRMLDGFRFLCAIVFLAIAHGAEAETDRKEGVVKTIIRQCRIESDEEYRKLLEGLKHPPTSVAPPEFRSLVKALSPFRMDLHSGIVWRQRRLTVYWFIGEFGVRKAETDVLELLRETLRESGFKVRDTSKREYGETEFRKTEGEYAHLVRIERLERFLGTKTTSSGGSITYEIEHLHHVTEPVLRDVLTDYPSLRCPEMLPEINAIIESEKVREVNYGGTWTRYYDFSVDVKTADEKSALAMFESLKSTIVSLGFSLDQENGGILTYMKESTSGPILYLSLEKGKVVNFRIQPYM